MIKTGSYTKTRAKCEFCGTKHSYKEDYCELKFDDVDVNSSVESASEITIGRLLDEIKYERNLVLAVVFKQAGS